MAQETITLTKLAEEIENGYPQRKIRMGHFESFADFMSYYRQHYRPLLEQLQKDWMNADGAQRFFASDMLEIFGEEYEE